MPKILLAILLFVVFFFPSSEVFAQNIGLCGNRKDIETTSKTIKKPYADNCKAVVGAICYKEISNIEAECWKLTAAAATSPSTSGSGQPCDLKSGQPHKLKPGDPVPPGSGIYTAIGCIPTEPKALVEGLLKYGTLAAGAIAFILMLLGALGLITAEGNPEAIKHSQETFYSAIVGLLLIIFSVLLMQVIGVDILGLPEFGR